MPLKATFPKNFQNQDLEGATEGYISENRDLMVPRKAKFSFFWLGQDFLSLIFGFFSLQKDESDTL